MVTVIVHGVLKDSHKYSKLDGKSRIEENPKYPGLVKYNISLAYHKNALITESICFMEDLLDKEGLTNLKGFLVGEWVKFIIQDFDEKEMLELAELTDGWIIEITNVNQKQNYV